MRQTMQKRGVSLIWAMMISTILLFVASTTANLMIKESQMGIRMDDSARAYAAAESGIEWVKWCMSDSTCSNNKVNAYLSGTSTYSSSVISGTGTATYTVRFTRLTGPYPNLVYTLTSQGTYGGVNRSLEYASEPKLWDNVDLLAPLIVPSSYVQQFDYWNDGTGGAYDEIRIGLSNSTGADAVYFKQVGTEMFIKKRIGGIESGSLIPINDPPVPNVPAVTDSNIPYARRIIIEYKYGTNTAKVSVLNQTFSDNKYTCIGSATLDMTGGPGLASLTQFYFASGTGFFVNRVLPVDLPRIINGASVPPGFSELSGIKGDNDYYKLAHIRFDNMATRGITYGGTSMHNLVIDAPDRVVAGVSVDMSTNNGTTWVPYNWTSASYPLGTNVKLRATVNAPFIVAGWGGNCTGSTGDTSVLINGDRLCTLNVGVVYSGEVKHATSLCGTVISVTVVVPANITDRQTVPPCRTTFQVTSALGSPVSGTFTSTNNATWYDITDPANPIPLGTFTAPSGPTVTFSFANHSGRVFEMR